MTDEEVIKKVLTGDKETYGEIVDRYQEKIFRYISRLSGRYDEVTEDLTEETLIKAYENLNGFDNKKKFSSWIYRIAHNITVDFFKKKKLLKTSIDDKEEWLVGNEKLLIESEIEKEESAKLAEALEKIDFKYREVLTLYYFEQKSYDEIADVLETSVGNVGVMINRAKKKLKLLIENEKN